MSLTRIHSRWALASQIPSLNNTAMSLCSLCVTSPCLAIFYAPFWYLRLIRIFLFIHSGLLWPIIISFILEWALLEIGGDDPGKLVRNISTVEGNQWGTMERKEVNEHRPTGSSCYEHYPTSRTTHCFTAGIGVDWVYPVARIREIETKN